jgi:hypothetical protein
MIRPLSRRAMLRGAGAAIALPLLDAMLPWRGGRANAPAPVPRLVVSYLPNGAWMDAWTPVGFGAGWVAAPSTAPLDAVRGEVAIFRGAQNAPVAGIHAERLRSLLSEVTGTLPYDVRYGRSFDRLAADVLAGDAAFSSLALSSEGVTTCSGPSHCDWLGMVSWDGEGQPVVPDIVASQVFARLFGDGAAEPIAALERRQRLGRSVLDAVLADADDLARTLGPADRARLDEHLTGVREVERRLFLPPPDAGQCGAVAPDDPIGSDEHVRGMYDLIRLALACDRTRVASYMIGAGESYRSLAFLGHPISHHSASHSDAAAHQASATWATERFATFVASLGATLQADGSRLLDDTVCVFVSDMSEGLTHETTNVPLVIGGGQRVVSMPWGQHVALADRTPLASVWLALLRALGHGARRFGDLGVSPAADWRR